MVNLSQAQFLRECVLDADWDAISTLLSTVEVHDLPVVVAKSCEALCCVSGARKPAQSILR